MDPGRWRNACRVIVPFPGVRGTEEPTGVRNDERMEGNNRSPLTIVRGAVFFGGRGPEGGDEPMVRIMGCRSSDSQLCSAEN